MLGVTLRKQFPIFSSHLNPRNHGNKMPPLRYLDSAATSQKPTAVINKMNEVMQSIYGPVHRGAYALSAESSRLYEYAREAVRDRYARSREVSEVIFTRGTTESLNILASGFGTKILNEKSRVVLPSAEHHANMVPWQQAVMMSDAEIAYIPLMGKESSQLTLDLEKAEKLITPNTTLVTLAHVGNVLGQVNDVAAIVKMAKKVGAWVVLDAAQSASTFFGDYFDFGVDAVVLSAHKIYGPTGIGALIAKRELLEILPPHQFGGGMISDVSLEGSRWAPIPQKFEAGSPAYVEAVGFGEAVRWLTNLNEQSGRKVAEHGKNLAQKFADEVSKVNGIKVFYPQEGASGVVSFVHEKIHAHDFSTLLDSENIAVRAGHHCAWPLIRFLSVSALIRSSFSIYNDMDDVEALLAAIKNISKNS